MDIVSILKCMFFLISTLFSPALAIGISFILQQGILSTLFCYLSTSLLFGTRCPRLSLFICCPAPKICHFSKDFYFFLLEKMIRNQNLSVRYALCYRSIVVSRVFQLTEQGNRCECIIYFQWTESGSTFLKFTTCRGTVSTT